MGYTKKGVVDYNLHRRTKLPVLNIPQDLIQVWKTPGQSPHHHLNTLTGSKLLSEKLPPTTIAPSSDIPYAQL